MNCLLVSNPKNQSTQDVMRFLELEKVPYVSLTDPIIAIEKAQEQHFDLILIDAEPGGVDVDHAIKIFQSCAPHARIIVHTNSNSRTLESKVRKEKIYYFHVNSFGPEDLKLAIRNALQER
jgi:DNA-binding NtrC family response regulator